MSVEDTLAERGKRYGDFTDHADLAQGLQFRMQKFCVKADTPDGYIEPWKDRLNNVQRQALTVIADKIARILSGDPNYADNWHDIQGYAKLVEDRLPKAPMTFGERCAEIDDQVQVAVLGSETNLTPHPDLVAAMRAVHPENQRVVVPALSMPPPCPECGCGPPTNMPGIHYATCSKLTAPKEFVEQVEATFDALEGSPEVEQVVAPEGDGKFEWNEALVEADTEIRAEIEADERMDNIARNGNDGEHYDEVEASNPTCPGCGREEGLKHRRGCPELLLPPKPVAAEDPFAGAPEWARYKAQDEDRGWWWYSHRPVLGNVQWQETPREALGGEKSTFEFAHYGAAAYNWRGTLIARP